MTVFLVYGDDPRDSQVTRLEFLVLAAQVEQAGGHARAVRNDDGTCRVTLFDANGTEQAVFDGIPDEWLPKSA